MYKEIFTRLSFRCGEVGCIILIYTTPKSCTTSILTNLALFIDSLSNSLAKVFFLVLTKKYIAIKTIKNELSETLAWIFTQYMISGTFPEIFKISVVTPVHNKNAHDVQNYRPVSIITIFEKKFEILIKPKFIDYFENKTI